MNLILFQNALKKLRLIEIRQEEWVRIYIYDISLNSSYNEEYYRQKFYRKSKHVF